MTILGALFTASTVAAQQSPTSNSAFRGKSTQPDSTTTTEPAAAATPGYGMTASRGARHLLRNGLDYINYQQYDRALKFLREAETRVKELNDAEKLALKQGIERAQRGLREASNAESPYAVSERSHHRNGFNPAKPESQVASNTDSLNPPARKPSTNRSSQNNVLGSEGEDRGEPIRLASGEAASSDQPPSQDARSRRTAVAEMTQPVESTPPARPAVEHSPVQAQDKELTLSPVPTGETPAPNMAAMIPSPAPPATPVPSSSELAQPSDASPAPKTAPNPTVINLETVSSSAPARDTAQPAPVGGLPHKELEDAAPASMANPVPDALPAPTAAPANQPVAPDAARELSSFPPELSHIPTTNSTPDASSMPTAVPMNQPAVPDVAKELPSFPSELSRTARSNPVPDSLPPPTAAPSPQPVAPDPANELPPLPLELSRTAMPNPAPGGSPMQNTASPSGPAVSDAAGELPLLPPELSRIPTTNSTVDAGNDLPPLPPQLGRTATSNPMPDVSPTSTAAPIPQLDAPAVANKLRSPTVPGHTEEESLPLLPSGNEAPSTTLVTTAEGHNVDSLPAVALPQVPVPTARDSSGPGLADGRDPSSVPTDAKLPVLPAAGPGVVAPAGQPFPTTNPNLERELAATTVTGAEAAPDPASLPPAIENQTPVVSSSDPLIPSRPNPPSTLRPELQREVERIARSQEEELHQRTQNPPQVVPSRDPITSDLRTQTQLDISRAPSPAEARPIKAIPVPEDWVPLPPRTWSPQRKYWAAAATCHLPLYFQDPVLERYGHSVEQFVGPVGRYLTYPVDDPTQSIQRNQIIQPFFSVGLFALQIAALPYNVIMDPPWEAQYDLGYYRPGDNIPTDTYWLPLHGYGPPLHGSSY